MTDFHLTNPEPHVPISAEAVEEIREVLIATRDRGGVGGIGLDLVRGATNALEELDALAKEYDCLVSGPYVGDDENGGGYFLFERRDAPNVVDGNWLTKPEVEPAFELPSYRGMV